MASVETVTEWDDLTLFRTSNRFDTLTGSELWDSVIVAVSLFLCSVLVRSFVTRVWINMPLMGTRCSSRGQDWRSYHQVCRLASIDGISRLDGIWSKESFAVDDASAKKYDERNVCSRMTTKCIGYSLLALELLFIAVALPTGSQIVREADRMVQLSIEVPTTATRVRLRDEPCQTGSFVEQPFVSNSGTWSICVISVPAPPSADHDYTPGRSGFVVAPEMAGGVVTALKGGLYFGSSSTQLRWVADMRVRSNASVFVEMLTNSVEQVHEAIRANLEMVGAEEGFFAEEISVSDSNNFIGFVLNYENLKGESELPLLEAAGTRASELLLSTIIKELVTGVLSINVEGKASRLYKAELTGGVSEYKDRVVLGQRTGPMITALGSIIATAAALVAWILGKVVFGGMPVLNWEIREAFGRFCCDSLMAGPDDIRSLEKSVDQTGMGHVGYGIRPGYNPVNKFSAGQYVE